MTLGWCAIPTTPGFRLRCQPYATLVAKRGVPESAPQDISGRIRLSRRLSESCCTRRRRSTIVAVCMGIRCECRQCPAPPESSSFAGQAGLSHSLACQNTPKRLLDRFPSQGPQVPPPVGNPEWSAPTVNRSTVGLWGVVVIRSRPTVPPPAPLSHSVLPRRARRGQRGRRRNAKCRGASLPNVVHSGWRGAPPLRTPDRGERSAGPSITPAAVPSPGRRMTRLWIRHLRWTPRLGRTVTTDRSDDGSTLESLRPGPSSGLESRQVFSEGEAFLLWRWCCGSELY